MVKADGKPEGFHRGRWKPVNGPREGGGLMRSSLRPRVMCGIRDSSHKHMHTQYTHTHTHTHSHTHIYTQIHTHTHTVKLVAIQTEARVCQQCIDLGCANYGAEALPA